MGTRSFQATVSSVRLSRQAIVQFFQVRAAPCERGMPLAVLPYHFQATHFITVVVFSLGYVFRVRSITAG